MKKTCLLLTSLWVFLSCTPIHQPSLSAAPSSEGLTQDLLFHLLAGEMAGLQGDFMEAAKHYLKAAYLTRDPRIAQRATQIALFAGDREMALKAARRWAALAPEDPEAHQALALIELEQGHLKAALQGIEKYLSLSPLPPLKRFMSIAALLSKTPNRQRALQVMEEVVRRHPSPEAYLAYGSLALELGRREEAMKAADKALALHPDMLQALLLKAQVLSLEDKKKAIAFLQKAVREHPHAKELRQAYARLLIDAGAWEKALDQFERLLEEHPDDADALLAAGLIALQLERLDQAEGFFLRLLKLGKSAAAAYFLGQIAENKKQYEQALHWYQSVTEGQYAWDAQLRIAVVLARLGRLEEARKRLHALPSPQPEQAIQKALAEGEMLREAGRPEEAKKVYDEALARFPDHPDLLYARALLAESMGDIAQAEKDLRRIIEHDPDNAQALNALGYTLTEHTDRYQEALGYIEKALKLRPEDAYILDSMGWVLYKMGHLQKALPYLEKAFLKKPDGEVAAHLVEVLWKMGRREEAREVWEKAWKLQPGHPKLKEVKARFFP